MRITLTIVALVEIAAAAAYGLAYQWNWAAIWVLLAFTSVGWAIAEESAERWKRVAMALPADMHIHRASCHGPAGELQCEVRA